MSPPKPSIVSQLESPAKSPLWSAEIGAVGSESDTTSSHRLSPRTTPHKQTPSPTTRTRLEHLAVTATPPITPPVSDKKVSSEAANQPSVTATPEHEKLESSDLFYTFSPPVALQTPKTLEQSTALAVESQTTPSLQFIFSPPLTRSMARRRSGVTSLDSSSDR